MITNQIYMTQAIKKAWDYQLKTYPNPTVGALIVCNNKIVALEAHQKAGTSHAEVLAFLFAYETLSGKKIDFDRFDAYKAHKFLYSLPKGFFSDCIIYVTLEPCSHIGKTPSCASLISELKPKKIVIATSDPIKEHSGGVEKLKEQGIEIEVGICEKEAKDLIEPFLIWQKRAFILFKIAQTSNGKIGGGYLSSKESLTHVHQLRSVCSKMIIGGNTVRVDRPTLDCRFIDKNKAPDIIIYSKRDKFDKKIPLFKIKEREILISSDLEDEFKRKSFILIEGGEGMLNSLRDRIDWLLQYQTPKLSSHNSSYSVDIDLEFLHQNRVGVDLRLWSRVT